MSSKSRSILMGGNKSGEVSHIKLASDQSSPDYLGDINSQHDDPKSTGVSQSKRSDYKYTAANLLLNAARGQHEINQMISPKKLS